jgi:hypothetical protein
MPYARVQVVDPEGHKTQFWRPRIEGDVFIGTDKDGWEKRIPLSEISYFLVPEKSSAGTGAAVALGVLSVIVVVPLSLLAIASCPVAYSFDGEAWSPDAEPYSGALAASCRRTDWQRFDHIRPIDSLYHVSFRSQSNETEYTDEVKLIVVDADAAREILPDEDGRLVQVERWNLPVTAVAHGGVDLTHQWNSEGEFFWEGDPRIPYDSKKAPREEMLLSFRRPPGVTEARLLLKGNNTWWTMQMLTEFMSQYGDAARDRLERLNADPRGREKVEKFLRESGMWIEVQVREGGEWKTTGFLRDVGPAVVGTRVLTIPFPEEDRGSVEIRLRWGPLAWNIMKVGMDFSSQNTAIAMQELEAASASDPASGDLRDLLRDTDGRYYVAGPEQKADFVFRAPPETPGLKRTVILKASGYYNLEIPRGGGKRKLASLMDAVRRRGLDVYSLERFQKAYERCSLAVSRKAS